MVIRLLSDVVGKVSSLMARPGGVSCAGFAVLAGGHLPIAFLWERLQSRRDQANATGERHTERSLPIRELLDGRNQDSSTRGSSVLVDGALMPSEMGGRQRGGEMWAAQNPAGGRCAAKLVAQQAGPAGMAARCLLQSAIASRARRSRQVSRSSLSRLKSLLHGGGSQAETLDRGDPHRRFAPDGAAS
ncbi:hypothetical protein OCJ37_09390 [Xanthomonas sp. AM6]|uniref:hypothetical protein n=1 Tax=Xanthomonas sp. AM6 TaxID=2982531 RepID=UPI0021D8A361|nr:hypothetical protein [Xanthomonas sp. AM6]UYB54121.1 hypothetical protein OCJ37_09390 [Xanthomonas sp. AM6]